MRLALEVMFEDTSTENTPLVGVTAKAEPHADGGQSLQIGNAVSISFKPQAGADAAHIVLEWEGGSSSDMLADAVIAIVLQVHPLACTKHASSSHVVIAVVVAFARQKSWCTQSMHCGSHIFSAAVLGIVLQATVCTKHASWQQH